MLPAATTAATPSATTNAGVSTVVSICAPCLLCTTLTLSQHHFTLVCCALLLHCHRIISHPVCCLLLLRCHSSMSYPACVVASSAIKHWRISCTQCLGALPCPVSYCECDKVSHVISLTTICCTLQNDITSSLRVSSCV